MFDAARTMFAKYYPKRLHLCPKKWTQDHVPLLRAAFRDQDKLRERLKLDTAGLSAFAQTATDDQ
jgi:hypothetical protein